jgi:small subunit ribosomal protein S3
LASSRTTTPLWYADRNKYAEAAGDGYSRCAQFIEKKLDNASVSRVVIERPAQTARITIHTARPGIVIGKKGEDVDKLRKVLAKKMGVPVHINIEEIRKPDLDARLVAQNVAQQLERRVMFRRAMKRVVQNAMRQGAEGIKVQVAVASAAPRSRARSGIARGACRCTRCARTSITPPTRRRRPTASSA